MSLLELKSFVKAIKPFDSLSSTELEELSSHLDIVYYKESVEVISLKNKVEFLFFIIKGVVQEKLEDEIISVYSKNEFFDPISLIENKTKHTFLTLEETICYALPKKIFLKMMYQNESLEAYFFSTISQKLNTSIQNEQNKKLLDFAVAKIEDAYLQKVIFVDEMETIYNTVEILQKNNIQSILVKKKNGKIGIVTDSDFVKKAILNRIDVDSSISQIASYDIKYIDATDFLFNAQLIMSKESLKRLVVKKDEVIIGILDIVSLNSFFASHTSSTSRSIENAQTIEELKKASGRFIRTIRTLYEKGVKVRYISKLISQLNEKLFYKLFILTAPEILIKNSCLIIMGSEGRGEQILRTDQDNGLILSDDFYIDEKSLIKFTQNFTNHLVDFGYPRCDGNIMVSNPFWVKSVSDFKETIFEWIHTPNDDNFMNLAIFYDSIAVCGDTNLLAETKKYLYSISEHTPSFNSYFAKPTLYFETPLGFFSDFVVDKKIHKDELDLKKGGIFPIVHGVRSLALEYKLKSTNTVERLKELNDLKIIDREFTSELIESFNFLLTLRLKFRLEKIDNNGELDNYINPSKLTILEKDLLKDSFKIVNKFKKFITYHYKLNILS